jgi:hypothetical protein
MNNFLNKEPRILPRKATQKHSFLEILGNLEKLAIIEEGTGSLARNSSKLDLSNSIYDRD